MTQQGQKTGYGRKGNHSQRNELGDSIPTFLGVTLDRPAVCLSSLYFLCLLEGIASNVFYNVLQLELEFALDSRPLRPT